MRKSRGPPRSDVFRVSDFSLILLKNLAFNSVRAEPSRSILRVYQQNRSLRLILGALVIGFKETYIKEACMNLKRMSSLLLPVVSLVNRRRHFVFLCTVLAAAVSVGPAGIATAEQCLVPTIVFTSTHGAQTEAVPNAEIYLADLVEVEDSGERNAWNSRTCGA